MTGKHLSSISQRAAANVCAKQPLKPSALATLGRTGDRTASQHHPGQPGLNMGVVRRCRSAAVLSDLSNVQQSISTPAKARVQAMESRTPAGRPSVAGTPGSRATPVLHEEGSSFKTRKQVQWICCATASLQLLFLCDGNISGACKQGMLSCVRLPSSLPSVLVSWHLCGR